MNKKVSRIITATVAVLFLVGGVYYIFPKIFADTAYPLENINEINKCADLFNLDKPLLAALIDKESGFNKNAVSRAGAMGYTQLMPKTYQGVNQRVFGGKYSDPFDAEANICVGAAHLAGLLGTYDGDWTTALIAYNGGDGAAKRYLAARSTSVLVSETRLYAPKILAAREVYATMYADKFTVPSDGTVSTDEAKPSTLEVKKESEKTSVFWKGFIKDVFARYVSS
jgi:hypothetical protein